MAFAFVNRSFRPLTVPTAQGFGLKARYIPVENVATLFDHKFLTDRYSPKRAAVIDHYSRLEPDRLSWRVITNGTKQLNRAVLRNRTKRRWANAFAEALKNHGYYHNGRKRSAPKDGKNYIIGLKGTLEILIYSERGLDCPHRELVGAANALVKVVKSQAGRQADSQAQVPAEAKTKSEGHGSKAEAGVSSSLWSKWRNLF